MFLVETVDLAFEFFFESVDGLRKFLKFVFVLPLVSLQRFLNEFTLRC